MHHIQQVMTAKFDDNTTNRLMLTHPKYQPLQITKKFCSRERENKCLIFESFRINYPLFLQAEKLWWKSKNHQPQRRSILLLVMQTFVCEKHCISGLGNSLPHKMRWIFATIRPSANLPFLATKFRKIKHRTSDFVQS